MCVCECVYMCICVCVCLCICVYMCIYACGCVYTVRLYGPFPPPDNLTNFAVPFLGKPENPLVHVVNALFGHQDTSIQLRPSSLCRL